MRKITINNTPNGGDAVPEKSAGKAPSINKKELRNAICMVPNSSEMSSLLAYFDKSQNACVKPTSTAARIAKNAWISFAICITMITVKDHTKI